MRSPHTTRLGLQWVSALGLLLTAGLSISDATPWPSSPERILHVTYSGTSTSDFEALFKGIDATPSGQVPPGGQRIDTALTLRVESSQHGEAVLLSAHDAELAIIVDGQPETDYARDALASMGHPILLGATSAPPQRQLWFHPRTNNAGRAIWQMLIGFLQFTASPTTQGMVDKTEEEPNGQYVARYTPAAVLGLLLPENVSCLTKTKVKYLPPPFRWIPGKEPPDKLITPRGLEVWCFRGNELLGVSAEVESYTSISGKAISYSKGRLLVAATHPSASRLSSTRRQSVANALRSDGDAAHTWTDEIPSAHREKMDNDALKGRRLDQLLAEIAAADAQPEKIREVRAQLYLALKALATLRPETLGPILAAFKAADDRSLLYSMGVAAIGKVGNAECQRIIRDLITDPSASPRKRQRAIVALTRGPTPNRTSIDLLLRLAASAESRQERISALYGLGTMSLMLRAKNEELHRVIDEWLLDRLQASAGGDDLVSTITAIGNAGIDQAIPALRPYLMSEDESIRRAAISALGWNRTPLAEEILLGAMATDPSANVRLAALQTYEFRPIDAASSARLAEVGRTDPSPPLRLKALNNLYRMKFRDPGVLEVIRERAQAETHDETRAAIAALLSDE